MVDGGPLRGDDCEAVPARPARSPIRTPALCALVAALTLLTLAYPPLPILTLLSDSDQYRQMGEALLGGHFFEHDAPGVDSHHIATLLRPPLFPLLLGLASKIPAIDPTTALIILHLLIATLIVFAAPLLLRQTIPPPLTMIATWVALYSAKQTAWGLMSEWLAMSCLLLSCMLYLSWLSRPTVLRAFGVSLFISLALLTRSALLPWAALLMFMPLQAPRGIGRTTAVALCAGLLPILLWCSVTLQRAGSFSLAPYEGLNLLATARSLGPLPLKGTDSERTRSVITYLNERGVTASDTALVAADVHRWEGEFYGVFHSNFNRAVEALQHSEGHDPLRPLEIAANSLRAHPDRYRLFARGGVRTLIMEYMPLIIACAALSFWLVRRDSRYTRWSIGVATICVVALGYLTTIFGTMLWLHRYIIPAQSVLLFCTVISTARLINTCTGSSASKGRLTTGNSGNR